MLMLILCHLYAQQCQDSFLPPKDCDRTEPFTGLYDNSNAAHRQVQQKIILQSHINLLVAGLLRFKFCSNLFNYLIHIL